jgi:hypothetical protein
VIVHSLEQLSWNKREKLCISETKASWLNYFERLPRRTSHSKRPSGIPTKTGLTGTQNISRRHFKSLTKKIRTHEERAPTSTPWPVHVRARSEENFRGFHNRLGKRRMGVDAKRNIFGQRGHFYSQNTFGDQFSGVDSHNAHA